MGSLWYHLGILRSRGLSAVTDSTTLRLSGEAVTVGTPNANAVRTVEGFRESEYDLLARLYDHLRPEDIFWDIGSNIGIYALFAGLKCQTVAFETDPTEAAKLRENVARNPSSDVDVQCVGLAEEHLLVRFDSSTSSIQQTVEGPRSVSVATVPGRWVIDQGIPAPTVIKIDVEGAEYEALAGLEDTLESVRLILLEYHREVSHIPTTDPAIMDLLDEFGFESEQINTTEDGDVVHYWLESRSE